MSGRACVSVRGAEASEQAGTLPGTLSTEPPLLCQNKETQTAVWFLPQMRIMAAVQSPASVRKDILRSRQMSKVDADQREANTQTTFSKC